VPITSATSSSIFQIGANGGALDVIQVLGNVADLSFALNPQDTSTAQCPETHKLIGGGIAEFDIKTFSSDPKVDYELSSNPDFPNNSWVVDAEIKVTTAQFVLTAYAMCAKINPMMAIGGFEIPTDTTALIIGYSVLNAYWLAPIGIGIGVGIYLVKRKIE